jgi:hypothetical protein
MPTRYELIQDWPTLPFEEIEAGEEVEFDPISREYVHHRTGHHFAAGMVESATTIFKLIHYEPEEKKLSNPIIGTIKVLGGILRAVVDAFVFRKRKKDL